MKVDLLCSDSYACFNIKLAQLFGIETAVYLNELINICKVKANSEGFFTVNRKDVTARTTLTAEQQLTLDKVLIEFKILNASLQRSDMIRLDLSTLLEYFEIDKVATKKEIQARVEAIYNPEGVKKTKKTKATADRENQINSLRNLVAADFSINIKIAFYKWIDVMFDLKKANKVAIETANDAVKEVAQGNEQRAVDFLTYVAVNSYPDLNRAKDWFKESQERQQKNTPYVAPKQTYVNTPMPVKKEGGRTF